MNTESVLPVLCELFVKSVLISLGAALLARAWRGATSAQRHLLWLVALAIVMLLPLTRLVAPQWAIPLQPAKKVTVTLPALPPVRVTTLDAVPFTDPIPAPSAERTLPDWRKILLGAWLSGTVFLLGYRLFGSWRLHRLLRRSAPVDDPRIRLLLSRTLSELGLPRRPEIRFSEECRVPITWGSLRPVMLLPKAALAWSDTWLTAALRHEAAHIRRYDYLTRWFAHVACALYWPNPLVWLLARSLRVAQELAADDLVLRAGTPPEEYATQLVDAARNVAQQGFFVRQAVAMACPSTLEDRVRAIVDGRRDRRPLSRLAAACGSIAIALALGLSTAAQLQSDEQKPAPAPAAAAVPPTASASTPPVGFGPQIQIELKFIEITTAPGKVPPPAPKKPAIYSDPQFQVVIRALNQKKGVDLLSAPRITTADNQQAVVEVGREFRYPTAWEKDGKKWKSKDSEIKKTGVTLDVTPRITQDGAIELHAVATIVEFKGFVDLDSGGKTPAKKKNGITMESEFPPVPAGHRTKPVFSEQKLEKTVTLKSGQTVEFFVGERADVQHVVDGKLARDDIYRRQLFLFISPRIINPAPAKEAPEEGAAATTPAPAYASGVLTVDKSGNVKLNGDPISIDDLKTKLRAMEASHPDYAVSLLIQREDEETPDKEIVDLLKVIRGSGVKALSMATPVTEDGLVSKVWKLPPNMIPVKPGTEGPDGVFVNDWLISKGVKFEGAASAFYIQPTSLIVSNTRAQLDLIDQIIEKIIDGGAGVQGAAPAGANPGTVILSGGTLVLKDGTKLDGLTVAGAGTLNIAGGTVLNVSNGAAQPATAADSPALAKAEKIVIPDFELREATLVDALDALRKQAVEFDPDKSGVKIVLKPGTTSDARITMSLKTIPVVEALKYLTGLAGLEFVVTPEALVVQPKAPEKAKPEPSPKGVGPQGVTVDGGTLTFTSPEPAPAGATRLEKAKDGVEAELQKQGEILARNKERLDKDVKEHGRVPLSIAQLAEVEKVEKEREKELKAILSAKATSGAVAEGAALAKARKIIVPKIEFREASVAEVLDFLRKKSAVLDPDKTGVNVVLQPNTTSETKVTLSLIDVPVIEAVRYLTGLANLQLKIEPNVLILAPLGSVGVSAPKVEVISDTASFDSVRGEAVFAGGTTVKIDRPGNRPLVLTADKLVLHDPPEQATPAEKPSADGAAQPKAKGDAIKEGIDRLGETVGGKAANLERLKEEASKLGAQLEAQKDALRALRAKEQPAPKPEAAPTADNPVPRTDPGDLFVDAYLVLQKSEKLEAAGQIQDAIQQMQLAAQKFEEVRKLYPSWRPQILDYRTKKVAEALLRLQAKQ